MKLKICGLKHPGNVRQLLVSQPDYLGFIFYKKSPRYAGETADLSWVKNLPGSARKVGVFVDEKLLTVRKTAATLGLHVIQLHGGEPPAHCEALRKEGLEIWKVFAVNEDFDFEKTKPYAGVCHKFLFDTKSKSRGGNGVAFDWSLLEKYAGETPFVLSGGIGPENAKPVKTLSSNRSLRLAAIDINSRFEIEPGLKDISLVKKFMHELF
ncbi:MAG: phosphoribosylanthranilate isomerase [Saprospiraceae bacterium]